MTDRLFGRFEVLSELARRGQISTLKCLDEHGSTVVLKLFESSTAEDLVRLHQRADALAALRHPGLAQSKGVAEGDDGFALVYAWVDGETIAKRIERGERFTDAELFELMRQVLEALEHAHGREPPVIHRDLKPQNIVWTGERYVLIDFGSAREVFADSGTASVVGTTGYAGPEQFVGRSECRSDQYGLAATVLHMATHRHPTDYPLAGLRIDLSKTSLSVPMRRLLNRMLEPSPDNRFDTAASALEAVATEDGLQPWEVALEPLKSVEGSVSGDRVGDQLTITIASRTSAGRWLRYAAAFVVMFTLFLVGGTVAQFGTRFVGTAWLGIVLSVLQFVPLMFAIYFGSKAREERRSGVASKILLTPDSWSLEQDGRPNVHGRGVMDVRTAGHSAAQSTGGLTPISIRESLVLRTGTQQHKFAYGLLPVEAKAVAEAVRAFQPEEVVFGVPAEDEQVTVGSVESVEVGQAAGR